MRNKLKNKLKEIDNMKEEDMNKAAEQYSRDSRENTIIFDSEKNGMKIEEDAFTYGANMGTIEHFLFSEFLEKCSKNKLNQLDIVCKGTWDSRMVQTKPNKISEYDDGKWYLIKEENCYVNVCLTAEYDGEVRIPMISLTTSDFVNEEWLRNYYYKLFQKVLNYSEYQCKYLQIGLNNKGNLTRIDSVTPDEDNYDNLIIQNSSKKFVDNFIRSVSKGKQLRYLFNGDAGTGKTECMRHIINDLMGNATIIEPIDMNPDNFRQFMDTIQYFTNPVLILDDVDLFLTDRDDRGGNSFLSNFLVYFDGIKKKKISVLASTNDKTLVDKAAERPGRFNLTVDFDALTGDQIDKAINTYFPERWQWSGVYKYMKEYDEETGKERYITGAFIANLVENLIEMEYDEEWNEDSIIEFIDQNYKGFYSAIKKRDKEKEIKGFV